MTRLRLATDRNRRRGFTLIELLVVISIIAVLMSLIAPAVQNARRAARRAQCLNNMHNLAVAAQNFASTSNGQLPQLWNTLQVAKNGAPTEALTYYHNWAFSLFPLMDQSAVFNSIRQASDEVGTSNVATLKAEDQIRIAALVCPEDINNFNRNLGLSYAANAGYINKNLWGAQTVQATSTVATLASGQHDLFRVDYNQDGKYLDHNGALQGSATQADLNLDAAIAVATGVFWYNNTPAEPKVTLDSLGQADGITATVMFTENVSSNDWSSADPDTMSVSMAVEPTSSSPGPPLPGATASVPLNVTASSMNVGLFLDSTAAQYQSSHINSQPLLNSTNRPRPSSFHPGSVGFVFCDGSTKSVNEIIDISVYARLLSPDGRRYGQVLLNSTSY